MNHWVDVPDLRELIAGELVRQVVSTSITLNTVPNIRYQLTPANEALIKLYSPAFEDSIALTRQYDSLQYVESFLGEFMAYFDGINPIEVTENRTATLVRTLVAVRRKVYSSA